MFKLWLLTANKFQLSWAEFFSSDLSFTDPQLFTLKWAHCVKGISECIPCVRRRAGGLGSVYRTASCDKLRIMSLAFISTHPNQTQTSKVSHTWRGSEQSSLLPHSPSRSHPFSFFPSYFHPLLMFDTLILNILFPVFWSAGFTCRWAGNLHRLKGLPSLLMLSDNGVSIHPLC